MLPRHPFEALTAAGLRRTALLSSAASLALGALMLGGGGVLRGPGAPRGLVSFELCADPAALAALFAGWGPAGRARARLMTEVDYGFLAAYAASLASLALALPGAGRLPGLARAAAWAAFAAAACDAAENTLGLALLAGAPPLSAAPAMAACASVKFALVLFPLAWLPAALFIRRPIE